MIEKSYQCAKWSWVDRIQLMTLDFYSPNDLLPVINFFFLANKNQEPKERLAEHEYREWIIWYLTFKFSILITLKCVLDDFHMSLNLFFSIVRVTFIFGSSVQFRKLYLAICQFWSGLWIWNTISCVYSASRCYCTAFNLELSNLSF